MNDSLHKLSRANKLKNLAPQKPVIYHYRHPQAATLTHLSTLDKTSRALVDIPKKACRPNADSMYRIIQDCERSSMVANFSYSFDRETFHGNFPTRQEALKKGLEKISDQNDSPEMIYIGKRVPIDPGTSGLAEMVLGAMRRRVREESGDGSSSYLKRIDEHQLAELDEKLNSVIREWLSKYELSPAQSKISAISEHPVPHPSAVHL
jgi:hypothetical protein